MRWLHKIFIICAGIAATSLCVLPLMHTYLSDGESCTMVIRGFNLVEFSAWGCVPVFASLLIPAILFGNQTKAAKETALLILFIGNMVCYVHSFHAAKAWLYSLDGSMLTYHPGVVLVPLGFIMVLALTKSFDVYACRKNLKIRGVYR